MNRHVQDEVHAHSLRDPESFWSHQADQLHWHKKPSRALKLYKRTLSDGTSYQSYSWFPNGEISTSFNCVDRHVNAGNADAIAIIWDSPVTGATEKITYGQLLEEIEVLAGVLRESDVKKGDVVLIYMPMIPAALYAMLAVSRLGAIHTVVFGGFASASLAQRIDGSKPKAIMTASCGIEGSKGPLSYKTLVEGALKRSDYKPKCVMIWQRSQMPWAPLNEEAGERDWQKLVQSAKRRDIKAEAVPVRSNDGLYIIYTSGTTGQPKGVLREAGGHAVGLNLSIRLLFGIRSSDVMFCASDIGWVGKCTSEDLFSNGSADSEMLLVGHSYILYSPLLAGATTVLFEGKPIGTPDASAFWRIVAEHKVNTLFTAPTALRAIKRDDPKNKFLEDAGRRGGLKQLRALFLAGERSEPSLVRMYQSLLETFCAPNAQVIDNWWSSESGSPITGLELEAQAGKDFHSRGTSKALPTKPGAAGKAMPGFDVRIVNDDGKEVSNGTMGNIVLGIPLAPTGFTTLFNDEERFYKGYMKRFEGKWIDTGDAGVIDEDGFLSIMARTDDIINVAAHRFSTGAIEQAITSHASVTEACCVSIPDDLKGHLPFAFVTLSTTNHPNSAIPDEKLYKEVQALIRDQIGAIAALGGMIQGKGMIPRTRSGKTLRRVLRELVENAVHGDFEKEVQVPATVEDAAVIGVARSKIKEYFEGMGGKHKAIEARAKL
ncbi:uncharacterized protein KY384_002468 [Bacidia gigantensis]|uniref:uncharacterized protein n=1 Tax=Bacidia gigantensis TaxID=2732470 RepID=UPI001D041E00|nr:uncharacterized protein KY384_002468 [Bacidia gigantensis]KAG8532591.1 hypothetical protein KY384_002468 [Bacidia gigantensis]